MRGCHVESAVFDDPNLVSCGGLAPVVALAQRSGLVALVGADLGADLKVPALVAGMVTGADPIASMEVRGTAG